MSTIGAETCILLHVSPNPSAVGEKVRVTFYFHVPALETAEDTEERRKALESQRPFGITNEFFLELEITKPDGATQILGPFTSGPKGDYTFYSPSQVGIHIFQIHFSGLTNETGCYLNPSKSNTVELVVKQEWRPISDSWEVPNYDALLFGEIEKHLYFGNNLVKLKLELQGHELKSQQFPYPEQTVENLKDDLSKLYSISSEKIPRVVSSADIPDKILIEIRNNPRGSSDLAPWLVSLGYHVGFWWQTKHHGNQVLDYLSQNNERTIKDLDSVLPGIKSELYDVLWLYRDLEFKEERTFDLYRQITLAVIEHPFLGFSEQPSPDETGQPSHIMPETETVTVLFLAANPSNTDPLMLDEEARAIDLELTLAESQDKFDLEKELAVKADALSRYLLQVKPHIVHFSGHGSRAGQIYLEDETGKSHPVSSRALSTLFSILKDDIKCVILNACYTEKQAKAISEHIDCVIGMSKAIGDRAAIKFAQGFYRGIGHGEDVETAFKQGCVQIDLHNLDEQDTPQIIWRNDEPKKILFIESA